MESKPTSADQYIKELPPDRQDAMSKLRKEIIKNLPVGFREEITYGMISYVVPHAIYPGGYHCDPKQPLPFMSIASQKNFIAVYHMGVYADKNLLNWFEKEYAKAVKGKLDMGKSCIRFKKVDAIPDKLIGELAGKLTVEEWINIYEQNVRK